MAYPGPGSAEEPAAPDAAQATATEESPARSARRRGTTIGVIVAVVALIGAGIGTWVAVGHSDEPGFADPEQAARHLLTDVGNDDLIGVVNDLPPNEASMVNSVLNGVTGHLKQIGVVRRNVNAQDAAGLRLRTNGIRFDPSVQQVNDHVAITKLVAGTITIGSQLSADDYTANFLRTAFPRGLSAVHGSTTLDIAQQVRRLGHPVRLATVEVNGRWYPSLFYSIADSVLQELHQPWPARVIPAVGADIPNEAAEDFLQAVLNGDARLAVEHTDPDEMAALHDMGQSLVTAVHLAPADRVHITHVAFDDRHVPGGGVEAVVRTLDLVVHGQRVLVQWTDGCYSVQAAAGSSSLCAGGFADALRGTPLEGNLPGSLLRLMDDMFGGLVRDGVGIVTTVDRELWYVNPGLTASQLAHGLYGSITEPDLAQVLRLMSEAQ